jgi:CelD/BcsL family acetyltransferase involved in cellulose biosynthesis
MTGGRPVTMSKIRRVAGPADLVDPGVSEVRIIEGLESVRDEASAGCLQSWGRLADQCGAAAFFQRPLWCLSWYESYADEWKPVVLVATLDGRAIGVAPMARHRTSGQVAFAGAHMADYRDVLVSPGFRGIAVPALLRALLTLTDGRLVIGPTEPGSATITEARAFGERHREWRSIVRLHPCWRVVLEPPVSELVEKKKSVRRHRAHYRRLGDLRYQRITTAGEWAALREVFFEHHTLRQVYTGRVSAFHDLRARQFFDALVQRDLSGLHVSALWLGRRCLASHFGYRAGGIVYWGAHAMDLREEQHSPGQLLLADLIAQSLREGNSEIDFTVGSEDFKARFGTICVGAPQMHFYTGVGRYWGIRARQYAVATAKAGVRTVLSDRAWKRLRALAGGDVERPPARRGARKPPIITVAVTRERFRACGSGPATTARVEFNEDQLGDLVKRPDPMQSADAVRRAVDRRAANVTLHTCLADGWLAAYGWSVTSGDETRLEEFTVVSGDTPHWGGLHVEAIVKDAFQRGASRVVVSCARSDALRWELEELGFSAEVSVS